MMKFVDQTTYVTRHFTTDDGVEYRCDINGQVWDRRYSHSWEAVFYNEESDCKEAFMKYMSNMKVEEDKNPYDDFS